jgi:rhodanese-related sulfurtransferase
MGSVSMPQQLSPQELSRLTASKQDILLLDVREKWEYEITHLPDAVLIPMRELSSRLTELNPKQQIIVYCHHGARSMQACTFLHNKGFSNVRNLAGGIDALANIDHTLKKY